MIQRKLTTHLTHQGGRFLVRHQGEGHQSLVSLEGVQGMERSEALLEGLIQFVFREIFYQIDYLGGISTVESSYTVVELGYAGGHISDGELGLGLGKPNSSIFRPELWELDCDNVDVKGNRGLRSGGSGFGYLEDRFLLAERKHCRSHY